MNQIDYKTLLAEHFFKYLDFMLIFFLFNYAKGFEQQGWTPDFNACLLHRYSMVDFIAFLILFFVWNRFFSFMRMNRIKAMESEPWPELITRIVLAVSIGVSAVLLCAKIFGMAAVTLNFAAAFWSASLFIFLIYRIILASLMRFKHRRRPKLNHVIIVGLNVRSISLSENITRPGSGYRFLGFIDDVADEDIGDNFKDYDFKTALSIICSLSELEEYVSKNRVDELFVTLPVRSCYDEIAKIIRICTTQGIKTRLVNDLFDYQISVPSYVDEDISSLFIDYDVINRSALQLDLKRLFDIAVSIVGLVLLTPVFLIVSLMIYFDDGFPIFYLQERIGLNKRRFKMFKFRTMVRNADKLQAELEALNEVKGAAFKITNDPRITKSGNFLRKTSLDEIPQFVNVLLGSMSVIGPRPLPIRDFEQFYQNTHRRRFSVKPGITGLWQISGRSEIDFEEWMHLDLKYIDSWNFFLDIKILLKTIPVVLMGKGAK